MNRPCLPLCGPRLWPALFLVAGLSVTACTQVPELDATVPTHLRTAAYPKLVSLDGTLTTTRTPQDQAAQIEQSLAARRDRLQARSKGLDRRVVDPVSRKRMQSGVNR